MGAMSTGRTEELEQGVKIARAALPIYGTSSCVYHFSCKISCGIDLVTDKRERDGVL
jgi:hypothetical protein